MKKKTRIFVILPSSSHNKTGEKKSIDIYKEIHDNLINTTCYTTSKLTEKTFILFGIIMKREQVLLIFIQNTLVNYFFILNYEILSIFICNVFSHQFVYIIVYHDR
jgi:hypothetical protein